MPVRGRAGVLPAIELSSNIFFNHSESFLDSENLFCIWFGLLFLISNILGDFEHGYISSQWSEQPKNVQYEQSIKRLPNDVFIKTKCKIGFIYFDCKRKKKEKKVWKKAIREGLPKKTAVILDFVQITPPPPPAKLDNLYNFFLTSKF